MSGLSLPYDLPDAMSTAFDTRCDAPYPFARQMEPGDLDVFRYFVNRYAAALALTSDADLRHLLEWAWEAKGEWAKVLWWEVMNEQDLRRRVRVIAAKEDADARLVKRAEQLAALANSTPYTPKQTT